MKIKTFIKYAVILLVSVVVSMAVVYAIDTPQQKSYYVVYEGEYATTGRGDSTVLINDKGGTVIWLAGGVKHSDINRILTHIETNNSHFSRVTILGWYELIDERIKK